ncbi:MAG TPA: RNA-binding S4 domain-containing protein [Clostridia bacterium]|nr:RNA-binding S4 domain-containing protein [Clostridia bacterium]
MRLDKYLKVSRLIKRRTVANEACDAQRVKVNGKPARASYEVKPGDVLELTLGGHTLRVEVLEVAQTVRKEGASDLYRVLEQN